MEQPEIYLGDKFINIIVDGIEGWYMSAEKYVRITVDNFKQTFSKYNQRLPTHC